jgi:hypothetical protein
MNKADIWTTWFLDPFFIVEEQLRTQKERIDNQKETDEEEQNERPT